VYQVGINKGIMLGQVCKVFLSDLNINVNWCFLKCVKVCVCWNERNNRNDMHGATINIITFNF